MSSSIRIILCDIASRTVWRFYPLFPALTSFSNELWPGIVRQINPFSPKSYFLDREYVTAIEMKLELVIYLMVFNKEEIICYEKYALDKMGTIGKWFTCRELSAYKGLCRGSDFTVWRGGITKKQMKSGSLHQHSEIDGIVPVGEIP